MSAIGLVIAFRQPTHIIYIIFITTIIVCLRQVKTLTPINEKAASDKAQNGFAHFKLKKLEGDKNQGVCEAYEMVAKIVEGLGFNPNLSEAINVGACELTANTAEHADEGDIS